MMARLRGARASTRPPRPAPRRSAPSRPGTTATWRTAEGSAERASPAPERFEQHLADAGQVAADDDQPRVHQRHQIASACPTASPVSSTTRAAPGFRGRPAGPAGPPASPARPSCPGAAGLWPPGSRSVSRQPRLPQRQTRPPGTAGRCPISPARPPTPSWQPSGGHDAGADARGQPDVDHVFGVAAGAVEVLGQRPGVGVVDQLGRPGPCAAPVRGRAGRRSSRA